MTVSSTTNRKSFTGDAVTTSFGTSPVVFFNSSELVVQVVTTATGAATTLTENTHYTVTGGAGSTGTVNLAAGSSPYGAPSAAQTLVILRTLPLTQTDDFVNNDINDAEVVEDRFDKLTMMVQQLDEVDDRALKLSTAEAATAALTELPFDRASKFLAFDASKNLIAAAGTTGVPVSVFMATVLDDATAGAALTTLGVSAFAQTVLDDADAATARTTLGAVGAAAADVTGTFALSGDITPAQITANQNDYNIGTASVVRLSSDASRDVTGLAGGTDGRVVTKLNIGSFPIVLKNENAGSAAANRFALDSDVILQPGHGVTLIYDSTASRWRPMGSPFHQQGATSSAKNLFAFLASGASVTIAADELQLRDANGNTFVVTSVNVTPSLATAGANGLDTGAEAANTWYYGWVIAKPDGTVAGLFSASSTAPTMPAGYTFRALVGAYRNDSGSNLINFNQFGNEVFYVLRQSVLSGGTATVETSVSVASVVPPNASTMDVNGKLLVTADASSNVGASVTLRWLTGSTFAVFSLVCKGHSASAGGMSGAPDFAQRMPNNAQTIYYLNTVTAGSSPSLDMYVTGYKLRGVGGE